MKITRSKTGLVLQGYFRIERFRGAMNRAAVAQPKSPARPTPQPPRPELLPAKMRGTAAQARPACGSGGAWSGAPRPELLPGMGPSRVGPRRVAQARSGHGVSTTPIPVGQLRVIGEGRPLEPGVRQAMESFFQADFSAVRVHEGPAAPAMGALAFTLGEELHFAPGLYDPDSRAGVELLGHELTHVVQQRDGRVANPFGQGIAIVQDPALEAEADAMGRRVADEIWSISDQRAGQPAMAGGEERAIQARQEIWSRAPQPHLMPGGLAPTKLRPLSPDPKSLTAIGPVPTGEPSSGWLLRKTKRSAFRASPYSGIKSFHSSRLEKKYGGGGGGGPPRRPNRCPCGKELWDGVRPGFDDDTYDLVLTLGDNTCSKCGKKLARKRDRVGEDAYITVDHRKDWLTHVLNKTDTHRFTDKNGQCWEGYYKSEVASAYNDLENLTTMCSSCNPRKSGPKSYDRGDPTTYLGKKG